MKVKCTFQQSTTKPREPFYECKIKNQQIPENQVLEFDGQHIDGKTNKDVLKVSFDCCTIAKVPQGLTKIFSNLTFIEIRESKLKEISAKDLIEYKNIKRLLFEKNVLKFLPGDLFDGFKELEWICFWGNQLKFIEPNILNGLDNLKLVNLGNNPNYNIFYAIYPVYQQTTTLQEIRDELYSNFFSVDRQFATDFIARMQKQLQELKDSEASLKLKLQENLTFDLKSFISNESTKDFKIVINGKEFPVHKFLLAARSPTLAELLKNNPDAENLNLIDISVEIFEKILKFFYTDEFPAEKGTNFFHLFAAAGKLKIPNLMNYAAEKILNTIEEKNAEEIFKIASKNNHLEMMQKAFQCIKVKYPEIDFKDEWMQNSNKVFKMINIIKKKKEAMRLIEEEFKAAIDEEL